MNEASWLSNNWIKKIIIGDIKKYDQALWDNKTNPTPANQLVLNKSKDKLKASIETVIKNTTNKQDIVRLEKIKKELKL